MWKIITTTLNVCHRRSTWIKCRFQGRRYFLSDAYRCQEAWERRLQAPILQNIKLDELYYELDHRLQQDGRASVIDVDLFTNAVTDEIYIEEVEDVLHKLRLSPNTVDMLPSTPHAFIRLLLAVGKEQQLLQILNDRLNYGVFPDDYCYNLLMDTFIKNKDYTGAAKVSVLQMLQEDWDNPLVAHLALYSCHMYLKEPGQWDLADSEDQEASEDNEEVKVRVKFLRNPFFDDHFDLHDPNLLVGKTLASLAAPMTDSVGRTYHLIGLCLYQKWEKCISLLCHFLANKEDIIKEGVVLVEGILEKFSTEDSFQKTKGDISALLKDLIKQGVVVEVDLHKAVSDKVQLVVKSKEGDAIKAQERVYEAWEKERLESLQRQIGALRVQQRLSKVQEEKEQLMQKEQQLYFFDNEEKWDLVIDSKRVFYPKRYFGKKKNKKVKDESYVPPEI